MAVLGGGAVSHARGTPVIPTLCTVGSSEQVHEGHRDPVHQVAPVRPKGPPTPKESFSGRPTLKNVLNVSIHTKKNYYQRVCPHKRTSRPSASNRSSPSKMYPRRVRSSRAGCGSFRILLLCATDLLSKVNLPRRDQLEGLMW